MSFGAGDNREILACFYLRVSLLSTCLRSNPLLACVQRALRAYVAIGDGLFGQARQPIANIAKLLCSCLCPLTLGAFVLLLRSLVVNIGICRLIYHSSTLKFRTFKSQLLTHNNLYEFSKQLFAQ